MRQFADTKLILLISESTERSVSIEEWKRAYEVFANTLFAANLKMERKPFHDFLCYTKTELVFWQSQSGLKKKWDSIILY